MDIAKDKIVCPHCGYIDFDIDEFPFKEVETDWNCERCGKKFKVSLYEIDYYFGSSRME